MIDLKRLSLHRLHEDRGGQVLAMTAMMLVGLLALTGFVVDAGDVYYSYRQLQSSTDAAALAGAANLPSNTAATTAVTTYSGVAGNKNATVPGVTLVSGYPLFKCFSSLGVACPAPANANGLVVKQQVTVPMYFVALVGFKSMTITATATAAMSGAANVPANVAIVVDATRSMNDTDSDSNCNDTRINCALNGVQTLLNNLSPCASSKTSCGAATSGSVTNPVDQVSLFSFPNVTTSTVGNDYDCSSSSPTNSPYTFPTAGANSYTAGTATYQILGYTSDYKTSDTSTLNTSSNLVTAMGGGITGSGKSAKTCPGMTAVGGEGTYYAGVIYAAQASLVTMQTANKTTQNVMIILSDGNAGTTDNGAMPGASTKTGTYPSTINQCQQAVTAAKAATAAGTTVYTVAYGAEASGCGTDTSGITPCQTMQQMASSSATFYSDYTATGGSSSCISASQPTTALNTIFTEIAGNLTTARLIPDNTQ